MDAARVKALLIDVTRFLRLTVIGFSVMLPLIGAAVVSPASTGAQLAALAAAGFAFHVFGYVSNDVFDLAIDRTQPLRAGSPLVRGLVHPRVALAIALVPVPLVAAIHVWAGGPPTASAALLAGMAFGLIYNLYGKHLHVPLVGDAAQGLAWVALVLYGALATGLPLRPQVAWLSATIFVYVLLVNAFHGGLRDLANDAQHGARTTAIYLGARVGADGHLVVPRALALYGLALQTLLLFLAVACVALHWPEGKRLPWQAMATAIVAAHLVLLRAGRTALRSTSNPPEMIRAGMLHLFLSIGVVCLPFAFFTNTFATVVIVLWYALPVLILFGYLAMHAMKRIAVALLLLLAVSPAFADKVYVPPRSEIVRAMSLEKGKGYDLLATSNGARFNAAVLLEVAKAAHRRDPARTPLLLDYRDYFAAFLQVNGLAAENAPKYIRIAYDHHENQYVDFERSRVIRKIGRQPSFAMNVVTGWNGPASRYSYDDYSNDPALRVTRERITSYRLLEFSDMLLFDDIRGVSGRALTGALGLIFRLIGEGHAVRSLVAVANNTQVTLTTGKKGFTITTPAVVDSNGKADRDVPKTLRPIEQRLRRAYRELAPQYAPLDAASFLKKQRE